MENEKNLFILIKRIHDKFEHRGNTDCKAAGLTIQQFRIIIYIAEHNKKNVTQKELETEFKVSHPTIVGLIKRLEEKEFVITKTVQEARQQKYIKLTQKGKKALRHMEENQTHDKELLHTCFNEKELKNFTEYMERLLNAIE